MIGEHRILIVDDDPHVRRTLARLLARVADVQCADGGVQALAILEEGPVHLIVSDHGMPEMSGTQFMEQAAGRWPQTARILVSGCVDAVLVSHALQQGWISHFFPKPWDSTELLRVVQEQLKCQPGGLAL